VAVHGRHTRQQTVDLLHVSGGDRLRQPGKPSKRIYLTRSTFSLRIRNQKGQLMERLVRARTARGMPTPRRQKMVAFKPTFDAMRKSSNHRQGRSGQLNGGHKADVFELLWLCPSGGSRLRVHALSAVSTSPIPDRPRKEPERCWTHTNSGSGLQARFKKPYRVILWHARKPSQNAFLDVRLGGVRTLGLIRCFIMQRYWRQVIELPKARCQA
jgi:hypothetical protein